jgi:hypothetical protein
MSEHVANDYGTGFLSSEALLATSNRNYDDLAAILDEMLPSELAALISDVRKLLGAATTALAAQNPLQAAQDGEKIDDQG